MSLINGFNLLTVDANNDSNHNSNHSKQTWLKFLESGGLNEALSKFEVMKINGKSAENKSSQTDIQQIKEKILESRFNEAGLGSSKNKLDKHKAQTTASEYAVKARSSNFNELAMVAGSLLASSNIENSNVFDLKASNKVSEPIKLPWNLVKYSTQNVVLSKTELGVELWIRDLTLSKIKLLNLLKEVKGNMGQLGASLVKVTLNGQEIFAQRNNHHQTIQKGGGKYGS